jgi:hypothetical protein
VECSSEARGIRAQESGIIRRITFIMEASESAGTPPPCSFAPRDSSLRTSSLVCWKVCSVPVDIVDI